MIETKNKQTALTGIINIINNISEENNISEIIKKSTTDLDLLSEYFKCNKTAAFFLSIIFYGNNDNNAPINLIQIADILKVKSIELYQYTDVFEKIVKERYIIKLAQRFSSSKSFGYKLNEKISENIIKNKALPELSKPIRTSFIDVLKDIKEISNNFFEDDVFLGLGFDFNDIVERNSQYRIFNKIKGYRMPFSIEYSFYLIAWYLAIGKKEIDISVILNTFDISESEKVKLYQDYVDENKNPLIRNKIIEINHSEFVTDSIIRLLPKGIRMLQKEGVAIFGKTFLPKEVLLAKNIKKTNLFFDDKELENIGMIKDILSPKRFSKIQKKLEETNLPIGITAIFYGYPGTGKTESILQLAKQTGRNIFRVDISDTKSKWFGESEKKIKQVFDDYKEYKNQCKKTPILLFNEADAILAKRRDNNTSNVSQTENSIQNILLEELENFEGIFLATTNLVSNLDSAFERRFLFKVEFFKPSIDVMAKIWKSKINKLNKKQCQELSVNFAFTGGQINNVYRKIQIFEIINDTAINFAKIRSFCEDEKFDKSIKQRSIGYTRLNAS